MQAIDPSGRYGSQAVLDALTGKYGGRVVDYRYDLLDKNNVKKADLVGVIDCKIDHATDADIKRTATFTLRDGFDQIDYLSDRIKPWWRIRMPDGLWVEWPQGVFLLSSPGRKLTTTREVTRSVTAYDQTVVLSGDKVTDRYSIAAGSLYVDAITYLVAGLVPVLLIDPSNLRLTVARDYDPGTTKLSILNDLLGAMNYRAAWFDETGYLICRQYVLPDQRTPSFTYAVDASSVLVGDIEQDLDLFNIPNRWTLVVSDTDQAAFSATYSNVSPSSPTSIPARGRTIVSFLTGQIAADQATLYALAARTGYEDSQVYEHESFDTLAMPFHQDADVLSLSVPDLGLTSVKVDELSWSLPMIVGGLMSHTTRRVVSVSG